MPEIRLESLRKAFRDQVIIDGLDLAMADKEFTVLVGPSGCGKSTTLRMIAGLETVSAGRILLGERDVTDLEPKHRDIAMVFQDYALYPHMDVARNMSFALRLAHTPRAEIEARVKRVAAMLDIAHLLDRKPRELSGGQRQRVAMGRALVRDSSTFLFDEPLSNLDAKLRGQMRAELALMRGRIEKNMIYVTHDQIEAMTLGDRIVVMHHGRIQQQGSAEELYKSPANRFVAGFIGSPPMNFLDARLVDGDGAPAVEGQGFRFVLPAALAARLAGRATREVVLGIRPTAFRPGHHGPNALSVPILVAEYIGAQSVLLADLAGRKITVEIASDTPFRVAEKLEVSVEPEGILLFDPQTDAAI